MSNDIKISAKDGVYFVTSTIIEHVPIFTSKAYFNILIDSLNFCSFHKNLVIHAWVILDDRFHLICQVFELSKTMQSLKRHTAREIVHQLENDDKRWILNLLSYYKKYYKRQSYHQIWQEGYDPQLIADENMLLEKIEYIHYCPVEKGLVDWPEYWRNSSASHYFSGVDSLVNMAKPLF